MPLDLGTDSSKPGSTRKVGWFRALRPWLLFVVFIVASGWVFREWAVGRPTTPMTLKGADRLYQPVSVPGQPREQIQAWLSDHQIVGDILNRRDDSTYKAWWMDVVGHQTVAEIAGLNVDEVDSVVVVRYEDAGRSLIGHTEISVFWFFDQKGRLLRRWANEFHISL